MKTKIHNITKHIRGKARQRARSKTKKSFGLRRPRAAIVPHAGSHYAGAARKDRISTRWQTTASHISYIYLRYMTRRGYLQVFTSCTRIVPSAVHPTCRDWTDLSIPSVGWKKNCGPSSLVSVYLSSHRSR